MEVLVLNTTGAYAGWLGLLCHGADIQPRDWDSTAAAKLLRWRP